MNAKIIFRPPADCSPVIKFPKVFRSDDLPTRAISDTPAPMAMPIRTQTQPNPQMQPTSAVFVPKSPSPTPSSESMPNSSWATVGKTASGGKSIDIAPKKPPTPRYMLFNVHDDRLDEELPKPDGAAQKRFNERLKSQNGNCCNEYHLGGKCQKGDEFCGASSIPSSQLRLPLAHPHTDHHHFRLSRLRPRPQALPRRAAGLETQGPLPQLPVQVLRRHRLLPRPPLQVWPQVPLEHVLFCRYASLGLGMPAPSQPSPDGM